MISVCDLRPDPYVRGLDWKIRTSRQELRISLHRK
jgi:hypothetical protein